ncbi:unnamed protein product [Enterobius vermicularis]|uniref:GB1/RHD3-type G domain-containing protein n=1 Tax=Enterobius vermicularis TaxID=51028 RepID=A0A0N4UTK0_ENTVE|nr:unnamed protein product [Enterobius vermicularis]
MHPTSTIANFDDETAQVLNILKKSQGKIWEPDEKALEKILMSKAVKDKKVAVISIAGPARSGKSFLLSLLLEVAQAKERGFCERRRMTTLGTGSGFSWRGGTNRETSGINMWSKPFLLRNLEGEEIAVLLMDTEGFFDAKSTWEGCARIFALSNLISSVQNLLYLVRDWTVEYEHSYGFYGGETYLRKFTEGSSPEIQEICRNIEHCFESSSCFLMPHPGLQIARAKEPSKSLAIDEEFRNCVQLLAEELFSGKYLTGKKIGGCEVTGKDLFSFFIVSLKSSTVFLLSSPRSEIFYVK